MRIIYIKIISIVIFKLKKSFMLINGTHKTTNNAAHNGSLNLMRFIPIVLGNYIVYTSISRYL